MTILDGTGHPARFGYEQCCRCATWRPRSEVDPRGLDSWQCWDSAWCAQNASQSPETARPAILTSEPPIDRGPYVAHAGSPSTGLDVNGDAT